MRVVAIAGLLGLTATAAADPPQAFPARSRDGATLALDSAGFASQDGASHISFCPRHTADDCETFVLQYCCEGGPDPHLIAQAKAIRERYANGGFAGISLATVHEGAAFTAGGNVIDPDRGPLAKRARVKTKLGDTTLIAVAGTTVFVEILRGTRRGKRHWRCGDQRGMISRAFVDGDAMFVELMCGRGSRWKRVALEGP